jgi:hypothetical protein
MQALLRGSTPLTTPQLPPAKVQHLVHELFQVLATLRHTRPSERLPHLERSILLCKALNSIGYKVFLYANGRITGARSSIADETLTNIPLDTPTAVQQASQRNTEDAKRWELTQKLRQLPEKEVQRMLIERIAQLRREKEPQKP